MHVVSKVCSHFGLWLAVCGYAAKLARCLSDWPFLVLIPMIVVALSSVQRVVKPMIREADERQRRR